MRPIKAAVKGYLKIIKGNAVQPQGGGHKVIIQIVNSIGAYGAGFSGEVEKRWPRIRDEYRLWWRSQLNFKGGEIQTVQIQPDVTIVNMIAQDGLPSKENPKPLNIDWLKSCLIKTAQYAIETSGSIHAPRIGCGYGGGKWEEIEPLIKEYLNGAGVNVVIYDLEEKKA